MSRINVDVGANTTRFNRGIARMENRVQQFGKRMKATLAAAAAAFVTRGLVRQLRSIASEIDNIGKIASRTGLGVRQVQELSRVADKAGVDIDTVAKAFSRFNREAQLGATAQTAQALSAIGTSMDELRGATPDETMRNLAAAFARIESPAMKSAIAVQLFGQRGEAMVNVLRELNDSTQQYRTLTAQQVRNVERMNDAWTDLKNNIKAATAATVMFFTQSRESQFRDALQQRLQEAGIAENIAEKVAREAEIPEESPAKQSRLGRIMQGVRMPMPGGGMAIPGTMPAQTAEEVKKEAQETEKLLDELTEKGKERAEKIKQEDKEAQQVLQDKQIESIRFEREMIELANERLEVEARIARLRESMAAGGDAVEAEQMKLEMARLEQRLNRIIESESDRKETLPEKIDRLEREESQAASELAALQNDLQRATVADSLQAIGGGGQSIGPSDKLLDKVDKQIEILREIRDKQDFAERVQNFR